MKLTAHDLYRAGIVEKVFPEPSHYTVLNLEEVTNRISESIDEFLEKYESMSAEELTQRRYERFRRM